MNVLINASAAAEGGALTILNSYLNGIRENSDNFIVLSPLEPDVVSDNIKWVRVNTNGIFTFMFSLFFSCFYYFWFRCERLVSFNNVNTALPIASKVTYFHNFLILNDSAPKYKLLRFALRYLNQRGSLYVFQTSYVRDSFEDKFGFEVNSKICWPGVTLPSEIPKLSVEWNKTINLEYNHDKVLVWPVSDIFLKHKNYSLLCEIASKLSGVRIVIPATNAGFSASDKFHFIGRLGRGELLSLMSQSDGVLITSYVETVCLPIFEAIALKKRAYVYRQPYIKGIRDAFPNIEGLVEFGTVEELATELANSSALPTLTCLNEFVKSDWDF